MNSTQLLMYPIMNCTQFYHYKILLSDLIINETTENYINRSILEVYFELPNNIAKSIILWNNNAHTMKCEVVFKLAFTFVVLTYELFAVLAAVSWSCINSSYLSCFHLVYNDSSDVCPCFPNVLSLFLWLMYR